MIRIGQISKIDSGNGMAQVTYEDQDDNTTEMLPILQPLLRGAIHDIRPETHPISADHFEKMGFEVPQVGDFVIVAHTDNDPSAGVILGRYYNEANPPEED